MPEKCDEYNDISNILRDQIRLNMNRNRHIKMVSCIVCGNLYQGETGSSGHTRICRDQRYPGHLDSNSVAAHLSNGHPEYMRDP